MKPSNTKALIKLLIAGIVAWLLLVAFALGQTVELQGPGAPYRATWPTVSVTPSGEVRVTCYGGQRSWMAQLPIARLEAGDGAAAWTILHPLNPTVLVDEPMHATDADGWTLAVASGRYGIEWPGFDPPDSLMAPLGRIFDPDGSPVGPDFPLAPESAALGGVETDWLVRVCARPGGGWLVAWTHGSGTGEGAWVRSVDRDGAVGAPLDASAGLPSAQNYPDVAALPDGSWLATFRHTGNGEPGGTADIWSHHSSSGLQRLVAGAAGEQRETRLAPLASRGWVEVHQDGQGAGSRARATLIRRGGGRAGIPFDMLGSGGAWIDPRALGLDGSRWVVVGHGRSQGQHVPAWRVFEGKAALGPVLPMFPDRPLYTDPGAGLQGNRITPSVCSLPDGRLVFAAAGAALPGAPISVWVRIEVAP